MTVVHLEPEQFMEMLLLRKTTPACHAIVLDCGIAGLVWHCSDGKNVYYMDNLQTDQSKRQDMDKMDPHLVHAEVYRKMSLDTQFCQLSI